MVELNNKLKLPVYTSFEHKYLKSFDSDSKATITCNDFEVINDNFDTSLDQSIEQVNNHLTNLNGSNVINIDSNKDELIKINIDGNDNFKHALKINIKDNVENKIYIESNITSSKASLSVEVFAGVNSISEIIFITKGSADTQNFVKANVEQDATCNIYFINSAANDLNDISVALLGVNSSSKLKTVTIAKEATKYVSARIDHFAKNSFGRLVNHGVGLDESKLVINGFGKIHKDCKQSDNYQKSKILALSPTAKVDANPILLIDEYDVWASHAASVSNVDPEQLYYLRSRGLNEQQAQVVLIKGFLKSIVNEVEVKEIAELFESILDEKIGYNDEF